MWHNINTHSIGIFVRIAYAEVANSFDNEIAKIASKKKISQNILKIKEKNLFKKLYVNGCWKYNLDVILDTLVSIKIKDFES